MSEPPSSLEVKKLNSWRIIAIVLLVVVIIMGAIVGILLMGQTNQQPVQQPNQSGNTQVKVLSDGVNWVTIGGSKYTITYKWMGYSNNIEVTVSNSNIDRILSPIEGSKYDVAGVEITISEVHDEYVILLFRQL